MARKQLPPPNELALLVCRDLFTNSQSECILRYWQKQWWRHDGQVYRRLESVPLTHSVREWVRARIGADAVNSGVVRSIIGELPFQPFVYVPTSWEIPCVLPDNIPYLDEQCEMERPTHWVNLANGIFDLHEWEAGRQPLQPHTATFFCTDCTDYGWDTSAAAPVFRQFLRESCSDIDQLELCLEAAAWFISWDNSLKRIFFTFGESDTGKSRFINDVVIPLVGEDAVSHVPLEAFGTRFGEMPLRGKKLNVCSEAKFVDTLSVERLKAISGGDKVTQDIKNEEPITVVPTARILASGNSPLRYADTSNGIWNRQRIIHFNNIVPREFQDLRLGEKLRAELPGIFRLVMLAWLRLRKRGDFVQSAISDNLVQQFRLRSNPPKMFAEECFVEHDEEFVLRRDIMKQFRLFCQRWSYKGGHSRESVFDELRRHFPYVREEWRSRRDGVRDRAFIGIRFSPEDASDVDKSPDDSLVAEALRYREEAERSVRRSRDAAKKAAKEAGRASSAATRQLREARKRRKAIESPKELKRQVSNDLRANAAKVERARAAAKKLREKEEAEREAAKREAAERKQEHENHVRASEESCEITPDLQEILDQLTDDGE